MRSVGMMMSGGLDLMAVYGYGGSGLGLGLGLGGGVREPSEAEELVLEVGDGADDLHGGQVHEGLPPLRGHCARQLLPVDRLHHRVLHKLRHAIPEHPHPSHTNFGKISKISLSLSLSLSLTHTHTHNTHQFCFDRIAIGN